MNASLESDPLRVVLTFLSGVVLIVVGIYLVYIGIPAGEAPTQPAGVEKPVKEPVAAQPATFKLAYQGRGWVILDQRNQFRLRFPEGLPNPATQPISLPTDFRSIQVLGKAFYRELNSLGWPLNSDQYAALLALEVEGTKLFPEPDLLEKLVSGKVDKTVMEQARASASEEKPPPQADNGIPARYNPKTEAFMTELKGWADQVQASMNEAARKKTSLVTLPLPDSQKKLTISFTDRARDRVRAADFGKQPNDWRIYLQVVFNQHGYETRVDGRNGPGTRKCAKRFANNVLKIKGEDYMALLNSL